MYAYFGHHKAGTTWILNVINSVCSFTSLKHEHFHSCVLFDFDLLKTANNKGLDFVSYTNSDYKYIKGISPLKGFHVIRDPRDIAVSAYFSHLHSHSDENWPELADHRNRLQGLSAEEGLLCDMEFTSKLTVKGLDLNLFACMLDWNYSDQNIMEVKFEELTYDPTRLFCDIFDFLGLLSKHPSQQQISMSAVNSIMKYWSFERMSGGRKTGNEDVTNHFRKGKPGDWKNHFKKGHKAFFKKNYPELLLRLGYEASNDW